MLTPTLKSIARLFAQNIKAYPHIDKLLALSLVVLFFLSWSSFISGGLPKFTISRTVADPVQNGTLGFQAIYALAVSGREDRTKPLLDAAKATNLSLTVLDAVRDTDIVKDVWPKFWNDKQHAIGELGCLVSHIRTWNRMISHNISTALIVESDADWDMRVKDIMPQLAQGVKTLVDWPFNKPHHIQHPAIEPYGDTWDVLWIGHCGSNHDGNIRIYSWNDTSVPPENREWQIDAGLTKDQHVPGTRTVYQFGRTTCSTAYGLTLKGAKKLVAYFKESNENLDIKLSSVCTRNHDMVCLGVWPQIITPANTKSNIDHTGNGVGGVHGGKKKQPLMVLPGPAIQYSARKNAKGVMEEGWGRAEWFGEWDTSWEVNGSGYWEIVQPKRVVADDG